MQLTHLRNLRKLLDMNRYARKNVGEIEQQIFHQMLFIWRKKFCEIDPGYVDHEIRSMRQDK
jgi:hypothetical protein